MKKLLTAILLILICPSLTAQQFIRVDDGQFRVDGKPYYFIGTNFWYGAILGSKGEGGDRKRLLRELDFLKEKGIDNLRILVGADGQSGPATKVRPTLQTTPGVYNEELLDGLDFLLAEMGKRGLYAVLYLNNSWEWSGGYSQYLEWAGEGSIPYPHDVGWDKYRDYVSRFAKNMKAMDMFKAHVRFIISRTNRYTGKPYSEDKAIMSWQVGNEPRAFGDDNKDAFAGWMREITALIRSLDPNHLISSGSEGSKGSENDIELWRRVHSDPNIDYVNIHCWPNNWRWIDKENIPGTLATALANTMRYIYDHCTIARTLGKPVVMEEFGMPRDGLLFTPDTTTACRDFYYRSVFDWILYNARTGGIFAGCNFWAWGGFARPAKEHVFWQKGDPYLGDPAQEEQGLNSVFDTDTTVGIIESYTQALHRESLLRADPTDVRATARTKVLYRNLKMLSKQGFMFGQQDATLYGIGWKYDSDRSDVKSVANDYPALYGWEIGDIELGTTDISLDSIHFSKIREHIQAAYRRGGVNTVSWHARNPETGGGVSEKTTVRAVETVLPGGKNNAKFNRWLDRVADFMLSLRSDDGELIPVIFRIWHEHTGNWFWWGNDKCTPEQYKDFYRYTVHYLRDVKGVHNILWAYSPDFIRTGEEYFAKFPGYEWVDILGIDMYHRKETRAEYIAKVQNGLRIISGAAKEHNKVIAMTEMGQNLVPDAHWWTSVMLPALQGYDVAYGLVWRNAYDRADHYFGTFPGQVSAEDFKTFAADPRVFMESELPSMYR